jgi:hypothetical protein
MRSKKPLFKGFFDQIFVCATCFDLSKQKCSCGASDGTRTHDLPRALIQILQNGMDYIIIVLISKFRCKALRLFFNRLLPLGIVSEPSK